jgi:hypothetical protein
MPVSLHVTPITAIRLVKDSSRMQEFCEKVIYSAQLSKSASHS